MEKNSKNVINMNAAAMQQELKTLVPSPDVRNWINKNNYTFSDMQKASIIWNTDPYRMSLQEKYFHLRRLQDNTNDVILKKQLESHLYNLESRMAEFEINKDRKYIYVLELFYEAADENACDDEDSLTQEFYFFDYDVAYTCGRNEKCRFSINKFKVIQTVSGMKDFYVAEKEFDKSGNLVYFYTSDDVELNTCLHNFTGAFTPLPNPFQRGDIVSCILDGEVVHGVVETSPGQWNDMIQNIQKNLLDHKVEDIPSYEDVGVSVLVVFEKDQEVASCIFNPLELEYYNVNENPRLSITDKFLVEISQLYKGSGSLQSICMLNSMLHDV